MKIQIFLISSLLVSSLNHFWIVVFMSIYKSFFKILAWNMFPGLETFKASRWLLTFCLLSVSFKITLTTSILFSSAERSLLLKVKKQNTSVVLLSLLIFNLAPSSASNVPVFLNLNIATKSFCVVPDIFLKPLLIPSFRLPGTILTGIWDSFVFVLGSVFLLSSFVFDLLIYKLIEELAGQPHCSFRVPLHFPLLSSETVLLLVHF